MESTHVGNLYQVEYWYWFMSSKSEIYFLYPLPEMRYNSYLTLLDSKVKTTTGISPGEFLVLLEVDGERKKFLDTKGNIGWIHIKNIYLPYFKQVSNI